MVETLPEQEGMVSIDYEALISRADLDYDGPTDRSEAGIPIGNGQMGSLVWTTPPALNFQINRVDVYANNSETKSFNKRDEDYGYGCGFVDIDFVESGPDVFTDDDTEMHLSVYDGRAEIKGDGVRASVFASQESDVMVVDIEDKRDEPETISTLLRMLRPPEVTTKHHTAVSDFEIQDDRAILTQEFTEADYYCSSALVVGVVGRDARIEQQNETMSRLAADPGQGSFTIVIASAASFNPDEDVATIAADRFEAAATQGADSIAQSSEEWWHDFWSNSFVHLQSEDGVADRIEANYTYFLYLMAASSRGAYPPNYGGMLWSSEGDKRQWGVQQWWTNISIYYRGLFPANRIELTDPLFDMYSKMSDASRRAARQQWRSEGLYFPETVWFNGLGDLPEEIADEMQKLYLLEKPWETRSEQFRDFAFAKHPHTSRWQWKSYGGYESGKWTYTDNGYGPYGAVTHFFSTGTELAYLYWKRYEYTNNKKWLRERAYPILKGVAEFLRNYPNLKQGSDGKYHLHHVNSAEVVLGAKDPMDVLVGMYGVLPAVIEASQILDVDAELREAWEDLLVNLAPLPTSDHPDALLSVDPDEPEIWVSGLKPMVREPWRGLPAEFDNKNRYYDFDIGTLEAREDGLDTFERASATFDYRYPEGITEETRISALAGVGVEVARLGRADDVAAALQNQIEVPDPDAAFESFAETGEPAVLPNRMTLQEGPNATGAQRLGNMTYALHEALCQSVPRGPGEEPVIRVFPAWPDEWDADFQLLCRGGFLVTASIEEGEIGYVAIQSKYGNDCQIRNPWGDATVQLYREGTKDRELTGSLFTFETTEDESIVIVPDGTTLEECQRTIVPE